MDEITSAQERLDFGVAGRVLYTFFWDQFADWYVEAAKTRLYGEDKAAAATTRQVRAVQNSKASSLLLACQLGFDGVSWELIGIWV